MIRAAFKILFYCCEGGSMIKYEKIIFICTGNTCRSPMAETIYKSLETNSDIKVISRGLVVLFSEPSNPKADIKV